MPNAGCVASTPSRCANWPVNAAYANQIQALTLANAQLGEQNLALHEAVQHAANVSRIGFLGQRQPPRVDLIDVKSQA